MTQKSTLIIDKSDREIIRAYRATKMHRKHYVCL